MGFFSPPSASSSSRHRHHGGSSSNGHRHRSGGGHASSSSSRHSGSSNGSGSGSGSGSNNPRKKLRGGDGSIDGAAANGQDPSGLYAGYDPSAGEYYYDYDESAGSGGYYAADGTNGSHGYYDHHYGAASTHPSGSSSSSTTPEEHAAAEAAAAAAAAAAGEEYYTASVSSTVAEHVYEAGMQFHGFQRSPPISPANSNSAGSSTGASSRIGSKLYALPNDETEKNRDDMKHSMALLLMQNRLFYAPVDANLRAGGMVYDLGTGTGIWAMDVAEQFPTSVVRGIDLSPIQPTYVPPNVSFTVDDFEVDWALPPNCFDLVHMRFSLWAVDDRAALMRRAFHHLKPGGFIEFQELVPQMSCDDGTLPPDSEKHNALRDFASYITAGLRTSDRLAGGGELFSAVMDYPSDPRRMDSIMTQELAEAGFTGIQTVRHKCPLGNWPQQKDMRRCGLLLRQALLEGLRGWSQRPLGKTAGGLGWTSTQIEIFLVDVRKAIMDSSVHAYFPMHVTYAQKPM